MTTTDTDALKERIARELFDQERPENKYADMTWIEVRGEFLAKAAAVLPTVAEEVRKAKAEAWDEGYLDRSPYGGRAQSRADNPYRETGDSDDHR